jgi:hypothetical protein
MVDEWKTMEIQDQASGESTKRPDANFLRHPALFLEFWRLNPFADFLR